MQRHQVRAPERSKREHVKEVHDSSRAEVCTPKSRETVLSLSGQPRAGSKKLTSENKTFQDPEARRIRLDR